MTIQWYENFQADAEGLGNIGEDSKKGRVGPQSVGNVLQGNDTGGAHIWLGDLVNIGSNVEDG